MRGRDGELATDVQGLTRQRTAEDGTSRSRGQISSTQMWSGMGDQSLEHSNGEVVTRAEPMTPNGQWGRHETGGVVRAAGIARSRYFARGVLDARRRRKWWRRIQSGGDCDLDGGVGHVAPRAAGTARPRRLSSIGVTGMMNCRSSLCVVRENIGRAGQNWRRRVGAEDGG